MSLSQAGPRTLRRALRLVAGAVLSVAAGLGASSCGGGGQVEPFNPDRMLVFGDELSVIQNDGRKYAINGLKTDKTIDCAIYPLWIQTVATGFGLVFPQCNPNAVAAPTSQILAQVGAKAADLKTQVDNFLLTGTFAAHDLVTMLVGNNDVFELYAQYPARTEDDITAELRTRGTLWASQVNRVALAGPAVLLATIPDLSLSPFALAERAAHVDTDRTALLRRLTDAYNDAMRLEIINDGRMIGLVFGDIEVQNAVRFPGSYGFANVTAVACLATAPLPTCTTDTLVTDGNATTWLWADATRPSPGYQLRLGNVALSRAQNSPF